MSASVVAMRYFSRTQISGGRGMTKRDAVVLASRTLAVLFIVWALSELSYLPERVQSCLHYFDSRTVSSASTPYLRHYYLTEVGFLATRIVGYSLLARWLYKCGPEVEELLMPADLRDDTTPN
jgi:hypothetical protein